MRPRAPTGPLLPPIAILVAAYLVGTGAGVLIGGAWWLTTAVGSAFALASIVVRVAPASPAVLLAAVALAGAGHARWEAHEAAAPPPISALRGVHTLTAVAREDATVRGTLARLDLDVEAVDGTPSAGGMRVTMLARPEPVRAGERVRVVGTVESPPDIEGFDYPGYLRSRDIVTTVAYPQRVKVVGDGWPQWRLALRDVRRQIVAKSKQRSGSPRPRSRRAFWSASGRRFPEMSPRICAPPARHISWSCPVKMSC